MRVKCTNFYVIGFNFKKRAPHLGYKQKTNADPTQGMALKRMFGLIQGSHFGRAQGYARKEILSLLAHLTHLCKERGGKTDSLWTLWLTVVL
jgi:hypothetical protein